MPEEWKNSDNEDVGEQASHADSREGSKDGGNLDSTVSQKHTRREITHDDTLSVMVRERDVLSGNGHLGGDH